MNELVVRYFVVCFIGFRTNGFDFRPLKKWEDYTGSFIPNNKLHDPPLTKEVEKEFV